jgi:hypothetical protein
LTLIPAFACFEKARTSSFKAAFASSGLSDATSVSAAARGTASSDAPQKRCKKPRIQDYMFVSDKTIRFFVRIPICSVEI